MPIVIGAAIALAGIVFALTRSPNEIPLSQHTATESPPMPVSVPAPVPASASPSASASAVPTAFAEPASASASARPAAFALATTSASASPSPTPSAAPPKKTLAGGFGDPYSMHGGAVKTKVQGREVRLFTRIVANESNVADAVEKKAIEWSSWHYLQCYERYFGGAKDLPEGTVVVSFEILDQLPRYAKVDSTTFASAGMADCVRSMLLGETINAAGPDGKGKVTHAFKFVPLD
jgi:hypothetical protein